MTPEAWEAMNAADNAVAGSRIENAILLVIGVAVAVGVVCWVARIVWRAVHAARVERRLWAAHDRAYRSHALPSYGEMACHPEDEWLDPEVRRRVRQMMDAGF